MKRIFISHAGPDSEWASRLERDLRNVGHDVTVDTSTLRLGDNSIKFMNEGLSEADVILILWSQNIKAAKFQQREVDAATWREINEGRTRVIVLCLPLVYSVDTCTQKTRSIRRRLFTQAHFGTIMGFTRTGLGPRGY